MSYLTPTARLAHPYGKSFVTMVMGNQKNLDPCKHRFPYTDCSILYCQLISIYEFSVIQPTRENSVIIHKYKS